MVSPTLNIEKKLWDQGFHYIAGLDEVGGGCFAGPVVVGAVIFPKSINLPKGLADSKLLKPKQREKLSEKIKKVALAYSIAEISVYHINKKGIGKATQMAFRKAVKLLNPKAEYLLIDAFYIKHINRKRQMAVKNGDTVCASISAASIIAKVYRDKLMEKLHQKYPQYGFSKHKGYGTKIHQEAIKKHGLCRIHRKSFNLEKFKD
ncbi:MAG: ribonuclease HII [Candidatus Daviesbacteria bacterium]|nr:ribonuclease HII [Candidatus Daviesbacteria bacterium]